MPIEEGHTVCGEWLKDAIQAVHGSRPEIAKVGCLGAHAIGYMSMMRRVELAWKVADEKLPKSVIVKTPSSAEPSIAYEKACGYLETEEEAQMCMNAMHDMEVAMYNMFRKLQFRPLSLPFIYSVADSASPVPVIVMEDIRNSHVVDMTVGFNEKQLFAIMDELIDLQFFSLTDDSWKAIPIPQGREEAAEEIADQMISLFEILRQKSPERFRCLRTFVDNTFRKKKTWQLEYSELYEKGGRVAVLTHGDLWAPQILWKDESTVASIVDWQLAHWGSPLEDILRILSTSTSSENRVKYEVPLIDYYYEKLKKKMESTGRKMPFNREYLDEELRMALRFGAVNTVFATGFWACSEVLCPGGKEDPKKMEEAFNRCSSYVEHVNEMNGWYHL